jgi:cytidylate kinase
MSASGLLALQQEIGKEGCVVMEGRDITTVVFPRCGISYLYGL